MNQTIDDRQSRLSRSLFFSKPIHRRTRNAGRAAPLRCRVPRPIRKDNNVNYAPTLTPPVELSWLLKIFPNSSIGVVSALKLFRTNQRTLLFQPRAMPRAKGRRKGATGSQLEQGRPNSVTLGTALQVVVWGGGAVKPSGGRLVKSTIESTLRPWARESSAGGHGTDAVVDVQSRPRSGGRRSLGLGPSVQHAIRNCAMSSGRSPKTTPSYPVVDEPVQVHLRKRFAVVSLASTFDCGIISAVHETMSLFQWERFSKRAKRNGATPP